MKKHYRWYGIYQRVGKRMDLVGKTHSPINYLRTVKSQAVRDRIVFVPEVEECQIPS